MNAADPAACLVQVVAAAMATAAPAAAMTMATVVAALTMAAAMTMAMVRLFKNKIYFCCLLLFIYLERHRES